MKYRFDLLACLPWFQFKPALFWRKIYIGRITVPQFLIVSAENRSGFEILMLPIQIKCFVMFWAFLSCLWVAQELFS